MKHFWKVALLTVALAGCRGKEKIDPQPVPGPITDNNGVVTPVGVIDGTPVTKEIGAAGGTLTTADNRISVNIPAGALQVATSFTIQPITNTNIAGLGKAFRITPHQTLARPATITIHYDNSDLERTFVEALGIAYQDSQGKWKAIGGVQLDKEKKTVTVKTTHFSDWSFFEAVFIEPGLRFTDPGSTVKLSVKSYFNADMDDLLYPLTREGEETYISTPKNDLPLKYIEKWELAGPGQLLPDGSHAVYQAPAAIPVTNPSTASVRIRLKNGGIGLVLAHIFVMPEGIALKVDGGPWEVLGAATGSSTNGVNRIGGLPWEGSYPECSVTWLGEQEGRWPWSDTRYFQMQRTGSHVFLGYYQVGQTTLPSPGYLEVSGVGGVGQYITGTFRLDRASSQKPEGDRVIYREHRIDGMFRVKRLI
ncbi:hypothetical protein HF324_10075 [Chitinophaga oryzae]|uniref:ZU5 domain-containing protein n=1 Tax=Chitinophaga oryzae TaxID=2725414 RepID=A0ABX6LDS0_9BACT|nr:hypothetical protein [Chitinophaga oryzae]QJB38187.1 hypothetical protein HF324_10075 [Chitinophaga oryzae]